MKVLNTFVVLAMVALPAYTRAQEPAAVDLVERGHQPVISPTGFAFIQDRTVLFHRFGGGTETMVNDPTKKGSQLAISRDVLAFAEYQSLKEYADKLVASNLQPVYEYSNYTIRDDNGGMGVGLSVWAPDGGTSQDAKYVYQERSYTASSSDWDVFYSDALCPDYARAALAESDEPGLNQVTPVLGEQVLAYVEYVSVFDAPRVMLQKLEIDPGSGTEMDPCTFVDGPLYLGDGRFPDLSDHYVVFQRSDSLLIEGFDLQTGVLDVMAAAPEFDCASVHKPRINEDSTLVVFEARGCAWDPHTSQLMVLDREQGGVSLIAPLPGPLPMSLQDDPGHGLYLTTSAPPYDISERRVVFSAFDPASGDYLIYLYEH